MGSGTRPFLIAENGKISSGWLADPADHPWEETERAMFNVAFYSWLRDAYPAVFDDVVGSELGNIPGLAPSQANTMLIALEYVEEFVAHSDVYPIDAANP